MSNNNWYETESWYAPLKREDKPVQQASQPAVPEKSKGKKSISAATVVLSALTLVAVLIAVLVLPSLAKQAQTVQKQPQTQTEFPFAQRPSPEPEQETEPDSGKDHGFGKDADEGKAPEDEQEDGDYPDDWDDFFDGFYQETDTSSAEVNIQQGTLPGGFSLQLKSAEGEELSLQELYEKCAPSIVAISGYTNGQSGYNWGTGVILSADGLILTNTHVIDACDRAVVTLWDDREFEAELVGADTISDLAVLKIDADDLVPAEFGESSSLRVGDRVAAIGNPLGSTFRSTLTDGIISAISRDISYKGRTMTLLQTNTALNEGNSGGALFNMQGQVVGITNMKMMSSYSSIEGIGFAIPSSTVRDVVNSMVTYGEVRGRPSIGITVGVIPDDVKEHYGLPAGLYVTDVQKQSDAWAKGIRPGDILVAVNSIPVTTTGEVTDIKNQFAVGDSLHFTLWRDGKLFELDVELMDTNDLSGG